MKNTPQHFLLAQVTGIRQNPYFLYCYILLNLKKVYHSDVTNVTVTNINAFFIGSGSVTSTRNFDVTLM